MRRTSQQLAVGSDTGERVLRNPRYPRSSAAKGQLI